MINVCSSQAIFANKNIITFQSKKEKSKPEQQFIPVKEIAPIVDKLETGVSRLGVKTKGENTVERLERGIDILLKMATIDELTGIANRRRFNHDLKTSFKKAMEDGTPLSLAMVDIDNLKGQVDLLGHSHGSRLIARIGRILKEQFENKKGITPYIFGGDEFCVIFEGIDAPQAQKEMESFLFVVKKDDRYQKHNDKYVEVLDEQIEILEKLATKKSLEDLLLKRRIHWKDHYKKNKCQTISAAVGDISLCSPGENEDNLFTNVDVALDKAKNKKNCIAYYEQEDGNIKVKTKKIVEAEVKD